MIKLNVGCGSDVKEGYINIDERDIPGVVQGDVRNLEYADGSVDEVVALDIIEHFSIYEYKQVLAEWLRVLRPGGRLLIKTPDIEKICTTYFHQAQSGEISWERLSKIINGGQDYSGNFHHVSLSFPWLKETLLRMGVTRVTRVTSNVQNMTIDVVK